LGPQVDLPVASAQTAARQIERKAVKPQNPMDDMVHSALELGRSSIDR